MTTIRAQHAYERALTAEQPVDALRSVAAERLDRGLSRDSLIEEFEGLRKSLRDGHREADEDVVLEVMDDVAGFTSPHRQL